MQNLFQPVPELISLSGWYSAGADPLELVSHVDLTFDVAELGNSSTSLLSFRVSLQSVRVTLVIPQHERAQIVPASVSRDNDIPSARQSISSSTKRTESGGMSVGLGATKGTLTKVSAKLGIDQQITSSRSMQLRQQGKLMSVIQRYDEAQNVVWDIASPAGVPLFGKPWDAKKKPRATLRREKAPRKGSLPPTLLIEVHCRRQDLKITDIQIRDKSEFSRLKRAKQFNNRMAAAECAIRERLIRNGANLTSPTLTGKIALAIFPCDEMGT